MIYITENNLSQYDHFPKAACTVLIRSDGCIAVCSRRNSNIYGLPGGKVDAGETSLQAAIRETAEETGVKIEPENLELLYSGPSFEEVSFFVDTFISTVPDSTKLVQMEEGIDVMWLTSSPP